MEINFGYLDTFSEELQRISIFVFHLHQNYMKVWLVQVVRLISQQNL